MENNPKEIEVGRFYLIHDDSVTRHPGFVVWKDDDKNRYLVIRTDSDKEGDIPKKDRGIKHITELKHTIGKGIVRSYVKNRPMLCKRKDIGKLLPDLSIHEEDMKTISIVAKNNVEISRSLRKRKKQ